MTDAARDPAVHWICFSRDRAGQADLLLRSMDGLLASPWTLDFVHVASNAACAEGYRRLFEVHPRVRPVSEAAVGIDRAVRESVAATKAHFLGFLVDDDVFVRRVRTADAPWRRLADDPDVVALSLRLDARKTYCQPSGRPMRVPRIVEGTFDWEERSGAAARLAYLAQRAMGRSKATLPRPHGCWRVPFSMDGGVVRTDRFQAFLAGLPPIPHATSLEPLLHEHRARYGSPRLGVLYEQCRLANLVTNNVDSQGARYPHPGFSAAAMNEAWLAGRRLALDPWLDLDADRVHVETPPVYEDEA